MKVFCEECRLRKRWPKTTRMQRLDCDVCGQERDCYTMPEWLLPDMPEREETK